MPPIFGVGNPKKGAMGPIVASIGVRLPMLGKNGLALALALTLNLTLNLAKVGSHQLLGIGPNLMPVPA